jgi:hypothetical protein
MVNVKNIKLLMIKTTVIILLFSFAYESFSQTEYERSYSTLSSMLEGQIELKFKDAVFAVESAFQNDLMRVHFDSDLEIMKYLVKTRRENMSLRNYKMPDSATVKVYNALFKTMTDTTIFVQGKDSVFFYPFHYDFTDMFGSKDWSNMFVTKLLATHTGNCHSMPYLYKILCDELGVPCALALAPNHIYIKHRSEKVGWYNTELTSAAFPIDAWLMASGYISLEAIQNGIYMEALDDKKCIALCAYDLAKGYDRKQPDNDGAFVLKCCDLALAHFPNCINALLLKAETRKKQFDKLQKARKIPPSVLKQQTDGKMIWEDMNGLYFQIHELGYRAMPEKMYLDWLTSLQKERDKFTNPALNTAQKH